MVKISEFKAVSLLAFDFFERSLAVVSEEPRVVFFDFARLVNLAVNTITEESSFEEARLSVWSKTNARVTAIRFVPATPSQVLIACEDKQLYLANVEGETLRTWIFDGIPTSMASSY